MANYIIAALLTMIHTLQALRVSSVTFVSRAPMCFASSSIPSPKTWKYLYSVKIIHAEGCRCQLSAIRMQGNTNEDEPDNHLVAFDHLERHHLVVAQVPLFALDCHCYYFVCIAGPLL